MPNKGQAHGPDKVRKGERSLKAWIISHPQVFSAVLLMLSCALDLGCLIAFAETRLSFGSIT